MAYVTDNYKEPGGDSWVVGGTLNIASGAQLQLAGTQVTTLAAELNYLDIATLGTGAASKAVVLDASGNYKWPTPGVLTFKTATGALVRRWRERG